MLKEVARQVRATAKRSGEAERFRGYGWKEAAQDVMEYGIIANHEYGSDPAGRS